MDTRKATPSPAAKCGLALASVPCTAWSPRAMASTATVTDASWGQGPHGSVVAVAKAIARPVMGWVVMPPRRLPANGRGHVEAAHEGDHRGRAPPLAHADPQRERGGADERELDDPHEQHRGQVVLHELQVGERERRDGDEDDPETDPGAGRQ